MKIVAIVVALISAFCATAASQAGVTLVSANPTSVVAKIIPKPGEKGERDLYMGAVYKGITYLRGLTSTDWRLYTGGPFPVAGKINMDGGPLVVTVADFDISSLVGLAIYVAYGVSESDALHTPGHMARIYTVPSTVSASSGFKHYGFYSYGATEYDLADLATYTHTTFASGVEQVQLAKSYGFRDIIYQASLEQVVLAELLANEGITTSGNSRYDFDFRTIRGYEQKSLELYRQRLVLLRSELETAGVLNDVSTLFLSDEPALHRNYIPSQAFLDSIEETVKGIFPDKRTAMVFAEDSLSTDPFRGAHFAPPPGLDVVAVDPYFWDNTSVGCSEDEIRNNLYETNVNSTINWALQFGKPIVVVGDSMLRNGVDPLSCYPSQVYDILRKDRRVIGLVWFVYDRAFRDGAFTGAANSPEFIRTIKNLTIVPSSSR